MKDVAGRTAHRSSSERRDNALLYHGLALAGVAGLVVALYGHALGGPFALDDHRNILENHAIRLPAVTAEHLVRAAFESPSPRPVANLSFALNYSFGGDDVRGYRAVNIAIHVLNAWLVYVLCAALVQQMARNRDEALGRGRSALGVALTAALVFAAHPIQTQAVTYVVQRMTSLCTFFYLVALVLYLAARSRESRRWRAVLYTAGLASWGLALATKQIALTLPLAIFLVEWFFLQDLSRAWLRRHARVLIAMALCGSTVVVAYLVLTPAALDYSQRDFTLIERLMTQLRVVVFYASLLVLPLPSRLNLTHEFTTSHGLLDPATTLFCLIALLGLFALAVRLAPRERVASFCVLWFFLQLALESTVIPLEMVFEHRLYLPLVGGALLVAYGLARLTVHAPRLGRVAGAVIIAALAVGTWQRNTVWSSPVLLWSDIVSKSPRDTRARNNLGNALSRSGRFEEAIVQYRETLRRNPGHVQARTNLALALELDGRPDEAWIEAERAARIDPTYARARYILGNMYARDGQFAAAVPHLQAAAHFDAGHAEARFELGGALIHLGRFEAALAALAESVRIDPTSAPAHAALGGVHAQLGHREAGRRHLSEALRLDPDLDAARVVMMKLERGSQR